MKDRDKEMSQPFPFWEQLKMLAENGKMKETDCTDTEGIFRNFFLLHRRHLCPFFLRENQSD